MILNKKKRICRIVDFAVLANHKVKLKQREKKDKYLDLSVELKKKPKQKKKQKLWNMKVKVIPNVIGGLGTGTKGMIMGLGDLQIKGRVETIQTTVLLRPAQILKRVLDT